MGFIPDTKGFTPDTKGFTPDRKVPLGVQNVLERPLESIVTPLAKTLTGRSLQERAIEATEPTVIPPNDPVAFWAAFSKSAIGGMAGELADVATTPLSFVLPPALKGVGKIPFRGTTLGTIASKVPIKQIFNEDVAAIVSYQNALKNLAARTAESRSPLRILEQLNNPMAKVTQALKEAGPIRAAQENLFTAERARRAVTIERIGKQDPGEAGFFSQLGALKGSLPKVDFRGIRGQVSQADVDGLYGMISKNASLDAFEKITAKRGLTKLFGEVGGRVPTEGEIELMGKVFSPDFLKTILQKRPALTRRGEMIGEIANIPRSLMTTFDMSAPLRQGIFLVGRPKQWIPAFGNMFKYFANERSYEGLLENIASGPNAKLLKKAGVSITNLGRNLSKREEQFMSSYAEKMPLIGRGVRASNRAFSGFLNKLRADTFDDFIRVAKEQRIPLGEKTLKDMGSFLNAATGRGALGPALERASVTLNGVFFSPRLISSRLTLMNPAYYTKLEPLVRKEALRSLFSFAGIAGSVLFLADLGGAKVGADPRSADFGKIKVGNTRYDVLGGFQQYFRAAAQIITGQHISSTTGVLTTAGEGFKPLTRREIALRFVEAKEAPLLSFASRLMEGKGFGGRELDIPKEAATRLIPMVAQDTMELVQEKGAIGIPMASPAFFGVGVQTYSPTPSEVVFSARSAILHSRKLDKQGDVAGSRKLLTDNKDLIDLGNKLFALQDELSSRQRRVDEIEKSKRLTQEQKRNQKRVLDITIADIEARMEAIVEQDKLRTP